MIENVYVGLDVSSKSTGVVCLNKKGEFIFQILLEPPGKLMEDRFPILKNKILQLLSELNNPIIGIESPSFFSKGRTIDIAAGWGYIYYSIKEQYKIKKYTPSQIKKFATGNGRATKEQMWNVLSDEIKLEFESTNYKKIDDIVDSYWIAKLLFKEENK